MVKQSIGDCDVLIAAGGGARHLDDIGLRPQVILDDIKRVCINMVKESSDEQGHSAKH